MPPKQWDEEDSDSSSSDDASPPVAVAARRKFDDEEDDSDVLDSWDAAEDSEVEREKAKKTAEAKAKAAAAAAAAKKPKGQRIAEHQAERLARKAAGDDSSEDEDEDEDEADRRERLRAAEQEADLKHAADLFGDIGVSAGRAKAKPTTVVVDGKDPNNTVDIAKLPLLNPTTKLQFDNLRTALGPVIIAHAKKPHYSLFIQEFFKDLARELNSEQIKKAASGLTALSNEKMKEEKAADKGSKKTKAAKTKASLVTGRANVAAPAETYDQDDFGE